MGSIWHNLLFENSGIHRTYKTGLGLVNYYDYDAGRDFTWDTTLAYYVKSGGPCGHYSPPGPFLAVNNTYLPRSMYTIYPNPAITQLTIESTNQPITQITITNLLGQTIYEQAANSLLVEVNVSTLSPGVYFIKVNGTDVRKFVKE